MKSINIIFSVMLLAILLNGEQALAGKAKGTGVVAGKGVVKAKDSFTGKGIGFTRNKDGKLTARKVNGTVSGQGLVIDKGIATGKGQAYGKGRKLFSLN